MKDWKYHCAVLRVPEDATPTEVRKAFRKLARELHPDKHQNSTRAKEEFQRLNESYRFLIAAFIEGGGPPSRPEPRSSSAPPAPAPRPERGPPLTSTERNTPKEAPKTRGLWPPPGYRKIWLHAAIACLIISAISTWMDLEVSRVPASGPDTRDLSPTAWCFVNDPAGRLILREFSSQSACEEKCSQLSKDKGSACTWSGRELRSQISEPHRGESGRPQTNKSNETIPLPLPPAPKTESDAVICEVTIERRNTPPQLTRYKLLQESGCRTICQEKSKLFPRAGIRCSLNGVVFLTQEATAPEEVYEAGTNSPPPQTDAPPNESTCFMTLVVPDEPPLVQNIPNQTENSCILRCYKAIQDHPLDGEVTCTLNGRRLVTRIPDPMLSYIAKHPDLAAQGLQQGSENLANCEVYGGVNGSRTSTNVRVSTQKECKELCDFEINRAPMGTEISCSHATKRFFLQTKQ